MLQATNNYKNIQSYAPKAEPALLVGSVFFGAQNDSAVQKNSNSLLKLQKNLKEKTLSDKSTSKKIDNGYLSANFWFYNKPNDSAVYKITH